MAMNSNPMIWDSSMAAQMGMQPSGSSATKPLLKQALHENMASACRELIKQYPTTARDGTFAHALSGPMLYGRGRPCSLRCVQFVSIDCYFDKGLSCLPTKCTNAR